MPEKSSIFRFAAPGAAGFLAVAIVMEQRPGGGWLVAGRREDGLLEEIKESMVGKVLKTGTTGMACRTTRQVSKLVKLQLIWAAGSDITFSGKSPRRHQRTDDSRARDLDRDRIQIIRYHVR